MTHILSRIRQAPAALADLIDPSEGRMGVVVCFLAVLELARSAQISVVQDSPFAPLLLSTYRAPLAQENENG
jgi:segregation and condensation protein A